MRAAASACRLRRDGREPAAILGCGAGLLGVIAVAPLFQVKDAEALRARLPQALKALAGLASRDGAGESADGVPSQ